MVRIDFTAPLAITDDQDELITDGEILRPFIGQAFPETDLLSFFGQSPEEVPVAILLEKVGNMEILANDEQSELLARSSVRSSRV